MTADTFGQCFCAFNFSRHDTVVVALSGGSDSTGLLVLLSEHLSGVAHSPQLIAVTIDHGLRPGSAEEAQGVATFCTNLGIRHLIKRWEGSKPGTGIQAAAREARYRLLGQASREVGATLVVTGHTEDDQLETVAMRAMRGEGPGLAGIARATLSLDEDGAMHWFARPLLGVGRARVRSELVRRNLQWIDDPSNDNPDFERVAMRQSLHGALPSKLEEWRGLQKSWSAKRMDLDKRVARLVDKHAKQVSAGLLCLSEDLAQEADVEAAAEVVKICAAHAGGAVRMMPVETVREIIRMFASPQYFRFTVSGALLERRKHGLFLLREKRTGGGAATESVSPSQLRALYPWALRVPLFDLNAASALARIVAHPVFPPSPYSP